MKSRCKTHLEVCNLRYERAVANIWSCTYLADSEWGSWNTKKSEINYSDVWTNFLCIKNDAPSSIKTRNHAYAEMAHFKMSCLTRTRRPLTFRLVLSGPSCTLDSSMCDFCMGMVIAFILQPIFLMKRNSKHLKSKPYSNHPFSYCPFLDGLRDSSHTMHDDHMINIRITNSAIDCYHFEHYDQFDCNPIFSNNYYHPWLAIRNIY